MCVDRGPIINYRSSSDTAARSARRCFWLGVVCGELLSILLIAIVSTTPTTLPTTFVYPHLFIISEAWPEVASTLPHGIKPVIAIVCWFMLGPLLFGAYALLFVLKRRRIWIALAVAS